MLSYSKCSKKWELQEEKRQEDRKHIEKHTGHIHIQRMQNLKLKHPEYHSGAHNSSDNFYLQRSNHITKKSSYKQKSSPAALHFWPGICSHTFLAQFYFCLKTGILQKAYLETVDPGFPRLKIDIEGVLIKLFCLNFWLSNHLDWVKGNNLPAASFSFCTLKMSKIFQHVLLSCGDTESRRNLEVKSLEFQSEKSEN